MVTQETRSKPKSRKKEVRYEDIVTVSRSFLGFICCYDPSFRVSDFSVKVAIQLERFYRNSQNGLDPNLLLEAPPQHGKSTQVAIYFPAWLLGINPNLKIVIATYSSELASDRCLAIKKIMSSSFYQQVFPRTKLPTARYRVTGKNDAFNFDILNYRGGLKAASVTMPLTGFSMDIGIIDDPYKDMEAARSKAINRKTISWYESVFVTRSSKIGGTVMMLTRWTINDLAGQLSKRSDWEKMKFKAIDSQGRALVPQLFSIRQLLAKKSKLPSFVWEAMYQQNPQIQGGNIVKEEWIQEYFKAPTNFNSVFITGDTAFFAHESCDFSVFTVWGESDNKLYLLDMWRKQVDSPELKKAAIAIYEKWRNLIPNAPCRNFYIENKSSGIGLIQDLKVNSGIPVKKVERHKDKYTRLQEVLTHIECGRLYLPAKAHWTQTVIDELTYFSEDLKHEHDDIVDTVIDALNITYIQKSTTMRDVVRSNKGGSR